MQDILKRAKIHVIEVTEENFRYNVTNAILEEIMAMNVLKLIQSKIQETLRIQRRIDKKQTIPMQSIVKLLITTEKKRKIANMARKKFLKTSLASQMQQ